jgi:hypothetical protein
MIKLRMRLRSMVFMAMRLSTTAIRASTTHPTEQGRPCQPYSRAVESEVMGLHRPRCRELGFFLYSILRAAEDQRIRRAWNLFGVSEGTEQNSNFDKGRSTASIRLVFCHRPHAKSSMAAWRIDQPGLLLSVIFHVQ